MKDINVTKRVKFSDNDGESLPITRCVCGEEFHPWHYYINIDPETSNRCPKCGKKLYFKAVITVYERRG